MSVDDWARREAEKNWPSIQPTSPSGLTLPGKNYRGSEIDAGAWGIVHAFSALLSDEAVEAAALALMRAESNPEPVQDVWASDARAALQAAVDAVTRERGVVDTSEATC